MSNDFLKSKILFLIEQRNSEHPISSVDLWGELSQMGYLNGQSKAWLGAKVREYTNESRCNGSRICSNDRGYWLAPKNEQGDNELLDCYGRIEHRCKKMMMAGRGMLKTVEKDRFSRELFQEEVKNV